MKKVVNNNLLQGLNILDIHHSGTSWKVCSASGLIKLPRLIDGSCLVYVVSYFQELIVVIFKCWFLKLLASLPHCHFNGNYVAKKKRGETFPTDKWFNKLGLSWAKLSLS